MAQSGKAISAEYFNARWRPALMAYFLRRIGNHAEAEDLTQDVFVRILRSDVQDRPDAFIFQIAANLMADRGRRFRVREGYRTEMLTDDTRDVEWIDPHDVAAGREGLAGLVSALQQLPERTRTMFILYRYENIGQAAIAETFGISKSAVKQQIAKAMVFLAAQMKDNQ